MNAQQQEVNMKGQEAFNKLAVYLTNLGLSEEKIMEIINTVSATIAQLTLEEAIEVMNPKQIEKWNAFVNSGANDVQQMLLLNKIVEKEKNIRLEDLQEEITVEICNKTIQEFNKVKNLTNTIVRLNEKELKDSLRAIRNGNFSEFKKIISNK